MLSMHKLTETNIGASMSEADAYNPAYAFARVNASITQGFYLEAMALSEVIMSHAISLQFAPTTGCQADLSATLRAWKPRRQAEADLRERITRWSDARRSVLRAAMLTAPGYPPCASPTFRSEARLVAHQGAALAHDTCVWQRDAPSAQPSSY